ncbi:MAG: sulfur relay protein DsrC [Alphaproteobacteria bacterium]|nr:sulfur relay protein DsrC [Alphaproteobacteria bacterium]
MIKVSDLVIGNPNVQSFADLRRYVAEAARRGYRFLQFDVKPDFVDTPRNWDFVLETDFYARDGGPK